VIVISDAQSQAAMHLKLTRQELAEFALGVGREPVTVVAESGSVRCKPFEDGS
jgi:hypothetical protein